MMGIGSGPEWGPQNTSSRVWGPGIWGPGIHIFTASWCGHCHTMKARNQRFGTVMKNHISDPSPHAVIQKFGSGFQVICHELTVERKVDSEYCEPKAVRTAASRSPVPYAAPRFSDASAKLPAGTVSRVTMVRPSSRA